LKGTLEEHFLYMFGGIQTQTEIKKKQDGSTGYQYMADMWKFNMLSNQWDVME
jgi:hypothetical protein